MTVKEMRDYIWEKRRQGLSDSQIARSLGMSLAHFVAECDKVEKALLGGVFKHEKPIAENAEPMTPEKPVKKKQAKKIVEEPPKETEGTPAIDLNDIL